jgi:hypothetical protein
MAHAVTTPIERAYIVCCAGRGVLDCACAGVLGLGRYALLAHLLLSHARMSAHAHCLFIRIALRGLCAHAGLRHWTWCAAREATETWA